MDWNKYKSYSTTNAHIGDGLDALRYCVKNYEDNLKDNVVADVEYVELESIPCICNKCKYARNAKVININQDREHEELLCDYNDYTKSVSGGKTECRHFELRENV